MGKVDCVMEAIENAKKENRVEIAKNLLKYTNLSFEEISKITGVDLETIEELKENLD